MWGWLFCIAAVAVFSGANSAGAGAARLVCYVESARADSFSECTHLVYTGNARGDKLDNLLKEYRKNNPRLKIILRVAENDKVSRFEPFSIYDYLTTISWHIYHVSWNSERLERITNVVFEKFLGKKTYVKDSMGRYCRLIYWGKITLSGFHMNTTFFIQLHCLSWNVIVACSATI